MGCCHWYPRQCEHRLDFRCLAGDEGGEARSCRSTSLRIICTGVIFEKDASEMWRRPKGRLSPPPEAQPPVLSLVLAMAGALLPLRFSCLAVSELVPFRRSYAWMSRAAASLEPGELLKFVWCFQLALPALQQ